MAEEERYILLEAAQKLGISKGTLVSWIARAGLRETVDKQVMEYDLRAHYLTASQLNRLAEMHRIRLATGQKTNEELEEARKRIKKLEAQVKMLIKLFEGTGEATDVNRISSIIAETNEDDLTPEEEEEVRRLIYGLRKFPPSSEEMSQIRNLLQLRRRNQVNDISDRELPDIPKDAE